MGFDAQWVAFVKGYGPRGSGGYCTISGLSNSSRRVEGNVEAEEDVADDAAVRNRLSSARNCEFSVDKVSISRPS